MNNEYRPTLLIYEQIISGRSCHKPNAVLNRKLLYSELTDS